MLQQINRNVADQMVHPIQGLVQCKCERLGAGQADHQGTHQTWTDGHRDAVDLR
jgi:hypothetical protein